MKYKELIPCLFLLSVLLAGCAANTADEINDYPHPNIAMLGSAASAELSYPKELDSSLNSSPAKLYELSVSVDAAKEQIEDCFGITLDSSSMQESSDFDIYLTDQYIACIDRATGYWTFEISDDGEQDNILSASSMQDIISDEDAINIAKEFVEENRLWNGAFFNTIVTNTTRGGWTSEENVIEKKVWFYPEVDGTAVLGIFRICVTVDLAGNITDVFKQVSDIVSAQNVSLADSEELKSRIISGDYSASFSEELTETTLTSCDLYYYADAYQIEEKTYLYPVYVLAGEGVAESGTTTFDIIVDALPS